MFGQASKHVEPVILSQDDINDLLQHHVQHQLGEGGSCTVYLVDYKGVDCCLKLANTDQNNGFMYETEVLMRLQGAGGGPQLLGATMTEGQHRALLTTFCGEHTFMQLSRMAQTDAEVLQAFLDLCRALKKVHARGYVHNDIKDNNVAVRRGAQDGRLHVSLIDYGLAQRVGLPLFTHTCTTKSWMAPEVFECAPCHASMDVYSLGHLLGQVLHICKDRYPRLEEVVKEAEAVLSKHRPSVQAIVKALERCLRPSTPSPFTSRLKSFFSGTRKVLR